MAKDWRTIVQQLPPGLTLAEVARRVGSPYATTRHALLRLGYALTDGRKYGQQANRKVNPDSVDWSLSNIEISRKYGISRERARVLRSDLGFPKVGKCGRQPNHKYHANIPKMRQKR